MSDASIIDGDALLKKDVYPTVLVLHAHLGQWWWKGEPINPSVNHRTTFGVAFDKGETVHDIYMHQTTCTMENGLHIQDSIIDVSNLLFESDICRDIYTAIDIKRNRLRRVRC